MAPQISIRIDPYPPNGVLNGLAKAAWGLGEDAAETDFAPIHARSLAHLCAYDGDRLVGYVNVAGDGGKHAFILDTMVHPDWQRQGIGRALVLAAIDAARARGADWLHVDYEPHLAGFYGSCGFVESKAGVMRL